MNFVVLNSPGIRDHPEVAIILRIIQAVDQPRL
jgi:hypothetical protein